MSKDVQQLQATWDAFLSEWPISRIRTMTLEEYTATGESHTFTAWIERRLDKMGSIWGGSSFKFGIYSRGDQSPKENTTSFCYAKEYAWYAQYGSTQEAAFLKVRALVLEVAESAARGDYPSIDKIDLGPAYKWKIAFHYQDRHNPGTIAVFKPDRLKAWLKGKVAAIPTLTSDLYREIIKLQPSKELVSLSDEVWRETADGLSPKDTPDQDEPDVLHPPDQPVDVPLNLILYGPPGTGKTYLTAELAVRVCDGTVPKDRGELMARYGELRVLQRIRFVTFHPSFSYEEFVEGIRPSTNDAGQIRYDVRPGVFRKAVTQAKELYDKRSAPVSQFSLEGRKLFKMSLGDSTKSEDAWFFPDCLDQGYVGHGFAADTDFAGCDTLQAIRDRYRERHPDALDTDFRFTAVHYLKNECKLGDLMLISDGNTKFRGIAEVTGSYFYQGQTQFPQRRGVKWLWTSDESLPVENLFSKRFSQMSIYLMDQSAIKWDAVRELLNPRRASGLAPNCVLVIDEINRANLAKTFGELITLLEPSKRMGQADEQVSELPYSQLPMSVPPNLYVIGTMNTADRSIALMDTALRRRFTFREMPPRAELLSTDVDGIDLQALLVAMNARIEQLFDRDHALGHTYLMGVQTFAELSERFRGQIIPLLQEYFFDDWGRIQLVFQDVGEPAERQIIQDWESTASGGSPGKLSKRYRVNPSIPPAAIEKIYP